MILLKGHNSTKGDNLDLKVWVSHFLMGNLFMEFKNPSLIFVRTDVWTDGQTSPQQCAPSTFSKGIKSGRSPESYNGPHLHGQFQLLCFSPSLKYNGLTCYIPLFLALVLGKLVRALLGHNPRKQGFSRRGIYD